MRVVRRNSSRISTIAVLLAALPLLGGGCAEPDPYTDAIQHARKIIQEYVKATGAPALQIAVAVDGRIVWSEAFGQANRTRGQPATTTSRFRIASVSKLLTGTLTAKLADEGVLNLDRPISEYVPDLPPAWNGITARMLVHHTSGIKHYADASDGLDTTTYQSTRLALRHFQDRPLAHPPGQAETYSSYAYTVLALAIEQATGRPFLEVMQQQILDPLRMSHTGPDVAASPPAERTAFYDFAEDGSVHDAPSVNLSGRWAGSGYLSTAEDLVRFGSAHSNPGMLSAGTLALVQQRQPLPDGRLTQEGFGWGPRTDWDGQSMLWGDGGTPGARGGLLVYPREDLAIAILTNVRGLALERGEFQTLARLFLAARDHRRIQAPPKATFGEWQGTLATERASLAIQLKTVAPSAGAGQLNFAGWRSLTVADMFQIGDTTWIVPLDREGIVPVRFTLARDTLRASAPRAGWEFSLGRSIQAPLTQSP